MLATNTLNGTTVKSAISLDIRNTGTATAETANCIVNKDNGKVHLSTCRTLPYKENRIYFHTVDEAVSVGYNDLCENCLR